MVLHIHIQCMLCICIVRTCNFVWMKNFPPAVDLICNLCVCVCVCVCVFTPSAKGKASKENWKQKKGKLHKCCEKYEESMARTVGQKLKEGVKRTWPVL